MAKVNGVVFSQLLFDFYGIELNEKEKEWFAFDGKELKGSILPKDTRGQAVALAVRHKDRAVHQIAFFSGKKESEVIAVRGMLKGTLIDQKITMDALHFKPLTLEPIHQAGGIYLVGLKANQKEMFGEMEYVCKHLKPSFFYQTKIEKGHGRKEQRRYDCYDISGEYRDKRWNQSGLTTLVVIYREREICNRATKSVQLAYFMSNKKVQEQQQAEELFDAIRQHWQVETANYIRDAILKEDRLRCIHRKTNQTMALCRTLVIKLLEKSTIKNKCEQMDRFADNFDQCLQFLKTVKFL